MATVFNRTHGVLALTDKLGVFYGLPEAPRAEMIVRPPVQLGRMWPPCALCGCNVNRCDCDPDEAQGAALAAMLNQPSKGEA